jgi:tetratricopeptide (TPR) repeat protein
MAGALAGRVLLGGVMLVGVAPGGVTGIASAQVVKERESSPVEAPELSGAVTRLLDQSYLTPEQARDLRVHHGVWRDDDLAGGDGGGALRARAALVSGRFWDVSFESGDASALDRAEALLELGACAGALEVLGAHDAAGGDGSMRARRLRAQAHFELGQIDEAGEVLDGIARAMSDQQITLADELVEGVRALLLRARMRGPWRDAQQDYRTITTLLARARDELDRMSWSARLLEAELLNSKDNRREARQAAIEALQLNPSCAAAWRLLGHMSVDQFDFPAAEGIAARLDALADKVGGGAGGAGVGVSPWAAEIRARAQLRQRDAKGAMEILDAALATHPTMRSLLALRAAASAGAFDQADADARLAAFDAMTGARSGEALYEVGRTLSDARQYEMSDAYLDRAAERERSWAEPRIERGLMLAQAGRDVESLDALTEARELDPFNIAVDNTTKLLKELLAYERFESEHFIVRCKPGRDVILAREMLPLLEAMHARVCGNERGGIDFEPRVRTTIDLMPNHEWFSVRITGVPGLHTMAAATGPIVAMESPSDGPGHLVGPYDWLRVVRHEYTHTVTLARTNNRIPHWFTEAAAVYLEDSPRDSKTVGLLAAVYARDELFDLEEINIAFVRPKRATDRSQAYAQGHWMYEYMIERFGARSPLDLMDQYAKGVTEEEAFGAVLGVSRAEFFEAFRVWAGEQLVAWGVRLGPGVPGAKELVERAMMPGVKVGGGAGEAGVELVEPLSPQQAIARALEEYPAHPELLAMAVEAGLQERGGVPDGSMVGLLERAAAAMPMDDRPRRALARLFLTEAQADGESEGVGRAIPHLEWLDAREVHSPAYASELARLYAERGEVEAARSKAMRVVRVAPFDADSRELAARVAIVAKDWDGARHQIESLMALEPDREIHKKRLAALEEMAKE